MAPLTSGRVNISAAAVYISKVIMDFKSGFRSVVKLLQLRIILGPGMQVILKNSMNYWHLTFFSFQIGLAIAIRYALSRRAFSITPNGPEILLLDYPSHQRRLLPLLAKT